MIAAAAAAGGDAALEAQRSGSSDDLPDGKPGYGGGHSTGMQDSAQGPDPWRGGSELHTNGHTNAEAAPVQQEQPEATPGPQAAQGGWRSGFGLFGKEASK